MDAGIGIERHETEGQHGGDLDVARRRVRRVQRFGELGHDAHAQVVAPVRLPQESQAITCEGAGANVDLDLADQRPAFLGVVQEGGERVGVDLVRQESQTQRGGLVHLLVRMDQELQETLRDLHALALRKGPPDA